MRRRHGNHLSLAAAVMLAAGCGGAQELEPAPGATPTEGPGQAVVEEAAGVRVEAQVDAWEARPGNLELYMTPVRVEIRNESGQALRVRYQEFALVEPDGTRRAAVPPFNLEGDVTQMVRPAYPPTGFYVAPHLDPFYDYGVYDPFLFDPVYYDRYYPYYSNVRTVELPTPQMARYALPEGMVEPGGTVAGFLYFEMVDDDVSRAQLQVDLVEARTGEQFGEVSIPFTVVQ